MITVVRQTRSLVVKNGTRAQWECLCDCGGTAIRTTNALRKPNPNCGCQAYHWVRHHGHSYDANGRRSPTYRSWQNMIARCTQPSNPAYDHYSRLGITICERWRAFDNFLADMGERPSNTTLDRRNNDGNYEPGNCRWTTKTKQANNRRTNIRFDYKGRSFTLSELARATGQSKETLRVRLVRPGGWGVEAAVETPTIPRNLRHDGR